MTEKYEVTVNDLYIELKKLVENGDGDKPVKVSITFKEYDHVQNLRAYSTDYTGWLLLMGYE